MSNEAEGMVKLAKGWKWVDFGVGEKQVGDVILRIFNREGYVERYRGSSTRGETGWDAEIEVKEEIVKKWTISEGSAWKASRAVTQEFEKGITHDA